MNPWNNSDAVVQSSVIEGKALVLDVPAIDANPRPDVTSLEWYKGTSGSAVGNLPNRIENDVTYHITTSLQLVILAVPSFLGGNQYQAQYANHFIVPATTRSNRFELVVSGKCPSACPSVLVSGRLRYPVHSLSC